MVDSSLISRIVDISYKYNLSHLGSNLSTVGILDKIYHRKDKTDEVVLSSGHAGLALYVVLEKYMGVDAEKLFVDLGVHPHKRVNIPCSTGSLGMGITYATGLGLAGQKTYCVISDGECAEGSVWESLAFIHKHRLPVEVHVNVNGVSAYDSIDTDYLEDRLRSFLPEINIHHTSVNMLPCLNGINAHYHKLSEEDYEEITGRKTV